MMKIILATIVTAIIVTPSTLESPVNNLNKLNDVNDSKDSDQLFGDNLFGSIRSIYDFVKTFSSNDNSAIEKVAQDENGPDVVNARYYPSASNEMWSRDGGGHGGGCKRGDDGLGVGIGLASIAAGLVIAALIRQQMMAAGGRRKKRSVQKWNNPGMLSIWYDLFAKAMETYSAAED